jgi:DNA-directed RNA polymerase subunit RPC12/RpoP
VKNNKKTGMLFQVRCACGAESEVDISTFGRPLRCKACSGTFKIVWNQEAGSKKKIPLAVRESGTPPRVFEIPAGAQEVYCHCGQHFLAWPRQVGKRVQCPICGTWLKLERYKDPQTLETRIRTVESRINRLPSAPRAKVTPEPDHQDILCTCGESIRMGAEHSGDQIQCPACGTLMRLEKKRDSETTIIALYPRIVGKGEPSEKRGIDEDLNLDDFG